jgi:hypothetical protein
MSTETRNSGFALTIHNSPVWPATVNNLLRHAATQRKYAKKDRESNGNAYVRHLDSVHWAQRCLAAIRASRIGGAR